MPRLFALLCLLLVVSTNAAIAAGKRVALVIGNASYTDVGALANPHADSRAVAEALTATGFDSVTHLNDLHAEAMRKALKDFSAMAATADVALVYYAGHGVEVADQNYLVPVDAKLLRSTDTEFEAISLASVRAAVSGAAKLRLVVLDACRNNPFKLTDNKGTRAATRGLGNIEPSAGEVVAYAAKEGTLAQDGPADANSPFATALVNSLKQPGLEIRLLFGKVRDDVLAATENEQEPYTYASLGGEAIYLTPPKVEPVVALQEKPSFRDCPDCPDLVEIPAGRFVMGSPDTEPGHEKDEGPQRSVTIGQPFAVGKFEITRKQYLAFVKATGHDMGDRCSLWDGTRYVITEARNVEKPGLPQAGDHPATCLSWGDAQAYVSWLSQRTGLPYRLLTESEWEYAARAGSETPYATGRILNAAQVNFNSTGTQAVGQHPPNAFGLHDMQGNVWEWTQDCHSKTYADAPVDGSAFEVENCERTYRGGAWANNARDLRFATRGTNAPDKRVNIFGLRVARDLQ